MRKKLSEVWDKLPDLEYTKKYKEEKSEMLIYEVLGRKFQETAKVDYVLDCLRKIEKSYGERSKNSVNSPDWKAVSHAFRACDQLIEIYTTGNLVYPLKNADFIKQIKYGKLHFVDDKLGEQLEWKLELVEKLASESKYPEEMDRDWCDSVILEAVRRGE